MNYSSYAFVTLGLVILNSQCIQVKDSKTVEEKVIATNSISMEKVDSLTLDADTVDLAYIMGKFDPTKDERFTIIPDSLANRKGMYLRKEAFQSFLKMHKVAKDDGVNLRIVSATRNFESQKQIWERKWADGAKKYSAEELLTPIVRKSIALKILEYSSMPSTSRHHWGTDIDLNMLNNEWFDQGEGLKIYKWLQEHGPKYGFVQVYTAKGLERKTGYNEERWHYTYLPLSSKFIEAAKDNLSDDKITGFEGADTAKDILIVENYVLGISKACFVK